MLKACSNLHKLAIEKYDWECENVDTQYITHSIHRYSGKFIPQIASNAIKLLTNEGDLVFDPYCGSGTTLLECAINKRKAIGLDLNPLAVLISKVKVTPVPINQLNSFRDELIEQISPIFQGTSNQTSLFDHNKRDLKDIMLSIKEEPKWSDTFFKKWFQDNIRAELIWIFKQIKSFKKQELQNIALVAFSDILRKSSNAHSSYPNVMFDKNKRQVPPAAPNFIRRLDEVISAVATLEPMINNKFLPKITLGSARSVPYASESFDAVITHPPYIGSVPYAEYGLLSLKWLGHDPKKLDLNLTGGKRQLKDVVDRFLDGFNDMFQESWRVLKKKGKLFMLLGSPTVKGKRIDLPKIAIELASTARFTLIGHHYRNGVNRRANKLGAEETLFFEK